MTVLGKILVFVNLVFSLVVGALIIMVFIARTHWAAEFNRLSERYDQANKSMQSYAGETQAVRTEMNERVKDLSDKLKSAQDELAKAQAAKTVVDDQLRSATSNVDSHGNNVTAMKEELKRRSSEVKYLEDQVVKLQDSNNATVVEMNKLRDLKVAAEIQRDSVLARNKGLIEKIEEQAKQIAKLKAPASTAATTVALTKNPPPEYIHGLIKEIDAGSGLMSITLGSDHGLRAGHTLECYRLDPAKYLGTLYVVEVRATTAVVRPMGKMSGQPQVGDQVASKVVGG
jgi:hypothetical protein